MANYLDLNNAFIFTIVQQLCWYVTCLLEILSLRSIPGKRYASYFSTKTCSLIIEGPRY